MAVRLKVSGGKNRKVFVSRVVRHGAAQMQFAAKIGHAVGGCVRTATEGKSHTKGQKLDILKDCMKSAGVHSGMTIGTINPNSYYHRVREGKVGGGQAVPRSA